jgi:hypothetical protein
MWANQKGLCMRGFLASVAVVVVAGAAFTSSVAVAASDADKAALQKATADCKAQVKDYAKYNETYWYQRHKMLKSCIKDALAKQ